jgi:hypothetical protein
MRGIVARDLRQAHGAQAGAGDCLCTHEGEAMTFDEFLKTIPPDDAENVQERAGIIEFYVYSEGEISRVDAERQAWDEWVIENVF